MQFPQAFPVPEAMLPLQLPPWGHVEAAAALCTLFSELFSVRATILEHMAVFTRPWVRSVACLCWYYAPTGHLVICMDRQAEFLWVSLCVALFGGSTVEPPRKDPQRKKPLVGTLQSTIPIGLTHLEPLNLALFLQRAPERAPWGGGQSVL